jgi:hypothetical protein
LHGSQEATRYVAGRYHTAARAERPLVRTEGRWAKRTGNTVRGCQVIVAPDILHVIHQAQRGDGTRLEGKKSSMSSFSTASSASLPLVGFMSQAREARPVFGPSDDAKGGRFEDMSGPKILVCDGAENGELGAWFAVVPPPRLGDVSGVGTWLCRSGECIPGPIGEARGGEPTGP